MGAEPLSSPGRDLRLLSSNPLSTISSALATVTGIPVLRAGCCGWCMGRSSYYRAFNAV